MKNIVSISRLGKLFLMELRLHRKDYLTLCAIVFAITILQIVSLCFFNGTNESFTADYQSVSVALIVFSPFILYGFVYHPTKGLTYAMLPASFFEKVLSAWIQCVIVVPILILVISLFGALASTLLGVEVAGGSKTFFENHLYLIIVQSLVFWGVFWFKYHKVRKTILTLCAIGFGIAIIALTIVVNLDLPKIPENEIVIYGKDCMIIDGKCIISRATLKTLGYFGYLIVPILPWALAFFKFRRTQI